MKGISKLAATILVSFGAATMFNCGGDSGEEYDAESGASIKEPVAVEAVTVTRGVLSRTLQASGTIYGAAEATVVSEAQGSITQTSFELGDRVKKGAVLVRVDDKLRRAAMQSAEQQFETASMNYESGKKLETSGGIARAELKRLRAAAGAARAAYEKAVKEWKDCTIRAPIAGYVATRSPSISRGNYLNRGVRIAHIVDLSRLRVTISVGEREVGLIHANSPATVAVNAPCTPDTFNAVVKAVAAGADPGTGSFAVVIEWDNTCGPALKSGMTASVTIPGAGQDTVVVVPTAALIKREGRDAVLIASGDRVVVRPVRMGRRAGNRTEILEGVSAGETVIMSALGTLAPNNPVIVTLIGESGSWK